MYATTHYRNDLLNFYRAMHYSAKRGLAIACHLSGGPKVWGALKFDGGGVRTKSPIGLSVCLSVCLSVTLVDHDHIG